MNVLERLEPKILQQIFEWDVAKIVTAVATFSANIDVSNSVTYAHSTTPAFEKMFYDIEEYLFEELKDNEFMENTITTPFAAWKRLKHQKMFEYGNRRRRWPVGKLRNDLLPDTIYTVAGYTDKGAFGVVDTLVVFNGKLCVIKHMNDERQPETPTPNGATPYRHTQNIYELIIHVYMQEKCKYRGLEIPELFFARRNSNNGVDACMARITGTFLSEYTGNTNVALAHILRQLFLLQENHHFMHRDLHGKNVAYDDKTHTVSIIDFGMSCINPDAQSVAWQSNNTDFYPILSQGHAAECSNRSLDICCLMAWLENKIPSEFIHREYGRMVVEFKRLMATPSTLAGAIAKEELKKTVGGQFTHITDNAPWTVGNANSSASNQHWWVYNTIEFPAPQWYPRAVLSRLLLEIPLAEWFPLRRNFSKYFDALMPKDVSLRLLSGQVCVLKKLVKNKLKVKFTNIRKHVEIELNTVLEIIKITP